MSKERKFSAPVQSNSRAPDSFCFQVNDIDENRSDRNPEEHVPVKEREFQKGGFNRIVKRHPEERYKGYQQQYRPRA
jgi:hypothetical protein